jgi:hypothetical protein
MPSMLEIDIEVQNICCKKALNALEDKHGGVVLPYRKVIRLKFSDAHYNAIGFNFQEAFNDLDKEITIPFALLDEIKYKYQCTEICPFPICLEELHGWERELVLNYNKIVDIISWIDVGFTVEKVSRWFSVDINDVQRWKQKRKKVGERIDIYKQLQDFIPYI